MIHCMLRYDWVRPSHTFQNKRPVTGYACEGMVDTHYLVGERFTDILQHYVLQKNEVQNVNLCIDSSQFKGPPSTKCQNVRVIIKYR